jgi:Ca2+/Na+ antiporter
MIITSLRVLALILLSVIVIIKEIPFKNLFKDLMIQFYMALTCMIILLLVDNIFGFILSICLLTLYFRIYTSELIIKNADVKDNVKDSSNAIINDKTAVETDDKCIMNMSHVHDKKNSLIALNNIGNIAIGDNCMVPYITEENLLAAQSNIFNPVEYNKEVHGVEKGVYNEDVYGSQGLDNKNIHIRGYDSQNTFLGSLSYDLIL